MPAQASLQEELRRYEADQARLAEAEEFDKAEALQHVIDQVCVCARVEVGSAWMCVCKCARVEVFGGHRPPCHVYTRGNTAALRVSYP
jgi:hypothetical protein